MYCLRWRAQFHQQGWRTQAISKAGGLRSSIREDDTGGAKKTTGEHLEDKTRLMARSVLDRMPEGAPGAMGSWGEEGHSQANAEGGLTVYYGVSSRDKQPRCSACQGLHSYTRNNGKVQVSTRF